LVALVAAACSHTTAPTKLPPLNPNQILAAPAALIAGTVPQANGSMWLLAGAPTAMTVQQIDLVTGKIALIVPISANAVSLAESSTGVLAVGYNTPTGLVEFRNGTTGAVVSTLTVGAPVKDIAAGSDGTTFFVLDGSATVTTVNVISSTHAAVPPAIGVSLDATAVALGPNDGQLYVLERSGSVDDITLGTDGAETGTNVNFPVGPSPAQMALSGDGSTLFVLKGAGSDMNVGVFNVGTERQTKVLPAPTNSVNVQVSLDATQIYVLVGTPTVGNIQVYPVDQ
jgi:hypothetical protein